MTWTNVRGQAKRCYPLFLSVGLSFGSLAVANTNSDKLASALAEQTKVVQQNKKSQEKIDALADQTSQLLDEYRLVLSEIDSLRTYNNQMEKIIASQKEEIGSVERQINQIEVTNKEVVPLMLRMIDSLDQFVQLDVPFHMEERTKRVASLREMMDRADVSTSEKYRRVLEAFQIENEFGRSIDAYTAPIQLNGEELTVDFLRVGRVALVYQTLDGSAAYAWDQSKRDWVELDSSYRSSINEALAVARRQASPNILTLPIPAATKEGA